MRVTVVATDVQRWTNGNSEIWDGTEWSPIVTIKTGDGRFVDLTTDQTINGQKTFSRITYFIDNAAPTAIMKSTSSNGSRIKFENSGSTEGVYIGRRTGLEGDFAVSIGGESNLDNYTLLVNSTGNIYGRPTATQATNPNALTRKDYVDGNFVGISTDQNIGGVKTFTGPVPLIPTIHGVVAGRGDNDPPSAHIEIASANDTASAYLDFTHVGSNYQGRILYTPVDSELQFYTGADIRATLTNAGWYSNVAQGSSNNALTRKDYVDSVAGQGIILKAASLSYSDNQSFTLSGYSWTDFSRILVYGYHSTYGSGIFGSITAELMALTPNAWNCIVHDGDNTASRFGITATGASSGFFIRKTSLRPTMIVGYL
jgi:hypothetical protein